MARRRAYHRRDLPPNLYERNNGYYTYRDPRTGKEYKLGRNKRDAVTQAIAANMALAPDTQSLVDRINDIASITLSEWIEQYKSILQSNDLKEKTLKEYNNRLSTISEKLGGLYIKNITTKDIAEILQEYTNNGKKVMSNLLRSTLSLLFKEAVAKGHIISNPVDATKNVKVKVSRERLTLEEFLAVRNEANGVNSWLPVAMDFALLTGQRVGDVAKMKWSDLVNNSLRVKQEKTNAMLSISIEIELNNVGKLSDVISSCNASNEYFISSKYNKPIAPDRISSAFKKSCKLAGINKNVTFHEIRSLSARLYAEQKGSDYAKKLLGHKSIVMTDKYLDTRNSEWVNVD